MIFKIHPKLKYLGINIRLNLTKKIFCIILLISFASIVNSRFISVFFDKNFEISGSNFFNSVIIYFFSFYYFSFLYYKIFVINKIIRMIKK